MGWEPQNCGCIWWWYSYLLVGSTELWIHLVAVQLFTDGNHRIVDAFGGGSYLLVGTTHFGTGKMDWYWDDV